MADIFLLFLAAYHYSAISTVILGFQLAEDRSVESRRLQHLSEIQQGKEGTRERERLNSLNSPTSYKNEKKKLTIIKHVRSMVRLQTGLVPNIVRSMIQIIIIHCVKNRFLFEIEIFLSNEKNLLDIWYLFCERKITYLWLQLSVFFYT